MEAPPKRWKKKPSLKPEQIAELGGLLADYKPSPLLLQLLVNRKVIDPRAPHAEPPDDYTPLPAHLTVDGMKAAVAAFLSPTTTPLPSPLSIGGVKEAVERIARALADKEKIAVYGDYDADGVTSSVLMTQALRAFGGDVMIYMPHRKREGYGLNTAALDSLAEQKVNLVITVDCGISNVSEAAHAQGRGLDLIVTDHHTIPGTIPNCIVINPKLGGDPSHPFYDLTGVGVAHQVVRALVEKLGKPPTLRNTDLLELVAIGTVADVGTLTGANRTLVALGLQCLRKTTRPGLRALYETAALKPDLINAHSIGFVIGPRLNAAGRLDDARLAYDLLMTDNPAQAGELAQKLEAENSRRQDITRAMQEEARRHVSTLEQETPVIIVRDANWDVGVVGLVAGRLCEEYGRPVFVLVEENGKSRGSARSPSGGLFDLHEMLTECADLLSNYGGHTLAAGLSLSNDNYEEFCERMTELADSQVHDPAQLSGELSADYELTLERVNIETMAELAQMEPFGHGNNRPMFVARRVRVAESKANGKDGRTLALLLQPAEGEGPTVRAVGFGLAPEWMPKLANRPRLDIMFYLKLDEWNGRQRVELEIKGLRLSKD